MPELPQYSLDPRLDELIEEEQYRYAETERADREIELGEFVSPEIREASDV